MDTGPSHPPNPLFDHLGEPVVDVVVDDDRVIVRRVNVAFEATFGVDEADLVGESLDERILPDSNRDAARTLDRRAQVDEVMEAELRRRTPDGERTFLFRSVPYTRDGEACAYAVYFDITDRVHQQERFHAFLQQSTDIVSVVDSDGTYRYMSPSVERITGYEPRAMLGDDAFEYIHPDDRESVRRLFVEAVEDPELVATAEFRFRHRDGSWVWLESFGNNQLENPAIEGFVVNSRDVTDRTAYERALERQNELLDEFASVVSHDLRNPLTVAMGRLALAREEGGTKHLEAVERAHERMRLLIDDLLTLSRAGESIDERQAVSLSALVRACWRSVETESSSLVVESDATISADESRLAQLLENLLRNAIQHGGREVTVTVGALHDGFYLEDDGPGVPRDDAEAVFASGYTTIADGSGFGLDIVQRIAHGHGWEVAVLEGATGGARFEVTGVEVDR